MSSKQFKALFGGGLKVNHQLVASKGGVQEAKLISSQTYSQIGLYLAVYRKDINAVKVLGVLAGSKLDDLAAQAFGHQVDPQATITSYPHLP